MSKFNKPHSFGSIEQQRPKFKPKRYPYLWDQMELYDDSQVECEACKKRAKFTVRYEERERGTGDLSSVTLCETHERLTRYGKFDQVFRDIDRKIEGK